MISTEDYKCIPVSAEIFSDITTPIQVLRILKEQDEHCFLLESVEKAEKIRQNMCIITLRKWLKP